LTIFGVLVPNLIKIGSTVWQL